MPKPRLRGKRRRDEITERHVRDLLDGPCSWGPWGDPWANCTPDQTESILADMRRAWESLRDELLSEWLEEHAGTRPWAWWQFDAPEGRRLESGPGASVLNDPKALPWAKRLHFGKPTVFCTEAELRSEWESEVDYLKRLDLLSESERVFLGELENAE